MTEAANRYFGSKQPQAFTHRALIDAAIILDDTPDRAVER